MALVLGDGFDHYPTALTLNKWDGGTQSFTGGGGYDIGTTYGRLGSQGASIRGVRGLTKNIYAANSGFGYLGAAIYVPSFSVSGFRRDIFSFYDYPSVGENANMRVCLEQDGSFSLRSGFWNSASAPYATTQPGRIAAGTWYYLEAKVKINSVSGLIELRINESTLNWIGGGTNYSGNTRRTGTNDYFTTIGLGGGNGDTVQGWAETYFDDFYYCDDTGAVNNSYLGDVALGILKPNGAGSSTQWTIGGSAPAATNWQSVDDALPDDDATLVYDNVVGHLDMYNMEPTSSTTTTIKGLLINCRIKKDDATARQYSTMVKDVNAAGATTAVATRTAPYGAYTNQQDVSEVSPTTGVAWTKAGVDAMEAGIKVIS